MTRRNLPETRSPGSGHPAVDDPHVTGLREGAKPGVAYGPYPLEHSGGIAGPHGANVPNEPGGPEGMVERENEDTVRTARKDD